MIQWVLEGAPAELIQEAKSVFLQKWFPRAWVRLADSIAYQYAGTGAKKADVILNGVGSWRGRVKDYTKLTFLRHVRANYFDAFKRDVMEVLYGKRATIQTP
jgi:hypothetical protein